MEDNIIDCIAIVLVAGERRTSGNIYTQECIEKIAKTDPEKYIIDGNKLCMKYRADIKDLIEEDNWKISMTSLTN